MSLLGWMLGLLGLVAPKSDPSTIAPIPIPPVERKEPQLRIPREAVAHAKNLRRDSGTLPLQLYTTTSREGFDPSKTFAPAQPPPGVLPPGHAPMAMDDFGWGGEGFSTWSQNGVFAENMHWLGFPYLAELSQRAEYRRIVETIARELTRRWMKLQATGDDDKSEQITRIQDWLDKHQIRAKFRRMAELDGFFGRGHLYIDTGHTDDRDMLKVPLVVDKRTIKMGAVRGFQIVEPTWTYPGMYNALDPLDKEFYVPRTWYVMGKEVHRTRLMTFVAREMPDLLKPAYSFGGLSLSQMAKPYVDNWLRTRQSVSDLVHSFSTMILMTDMSVMMSPDGADQMNLRAQLYNHMRDNAGLFVADMTKEDVKNVSAPLGGLDQLQAQSQEHMASVTGEPLVVLTGIAPSGLNATSEGELQVWAQYVRAMQEHFFDDHLETILKIAQLDLFGAIDDEIGYEWEPLKELSEKDIADARKADADVDAVYVGLGALGPEDIRQKLANEADSPYAGLDLSGPPPDPPDPAGEGDPTDEDPQGGPGGGSGPVRSKPGESVSGARTGALEQTAAREVAKAVSGAKDEDLEIGVGQMSPLKQAYLDKFDAGQEHYQRILDMGHHEFQEWLRNNDLVDVVLAHDANLHKVSKDTAEYDSSTGQDNEFCSNCTMFCAPDKCTKVIGQISPRGWCTYWDPQDPDSNETWDGIDLAQDAEFEESKHPRDEGGKFARNASGAAEGQAYHEAKSQEFRKTGSMHVHRPHARAAKAYAEAREHYEAGREAEGHEAHKRGMREGRAAAGREAKHTEGKGESKPPPAEPEQKEEPKKVKPPPRAEEKKEPEKPSGGALTVQARTERGKQVRQKMVLGQQSSERRWHQTPAWDHATDEFSYAMAGVKPLDKVLNLGRDTQYYQRMGHWVNMHTSDALRPTDMDQAVWRHEFAHAMDFNGSLNAMSDQAYHELLEEGRVIAASEPRKPGDTLRATEAVRNLEYRDDIPRELIDFVQPGAEHVGQLLHSNKFKMAGLLHTLETGTLMPGNYALYPGESRSHHAMFADFLGAMTLNAVGGGHSKEYYKQDAGRSRCHEAFANYVCLTQGQGGDVYKTVLSALAPRTCKKFDEIIEHRARAGKAKLG